MALSVVEETNLAAYRRDLLLPEHRESAPHAHHGAVTGFRPDGLVVVQQLEPAQAYRRARPVSLLSVSTFAFAKLATRASQRPSRCHFCTVSSPR